MAHEGIKQEHIVLALNDLVTIKGTESDDITNAFHGGAQLVGQGRLFVYANTFFVDHGQPRYTIYEVVRRGDPMMRDHTLLRAVREPDEVALLSELYKATKGL